MRKLTSLVRLKDVCTDPEDIFESGVEQLFSFTTHALHGQPGNDIIYLSRKFGEILLSLVDPQASDERNLFAHYLWNSAIHLAELISGEHDPTIEHWSVEGETVLELGAGWSQPSYKPR